MTLIEKILLIALGVVFAATLVLDIFNKDDNVDISDWEEF